MYKITNVALDHKYSFQRSRAAKLQMEPMVAGRRLKLRATLEISDKLFERNKKDIELAKAHGVLLYEQISVDEEAAPSVSFPVSPEPAAGDGDIPQALPDLGTDQDRFERAREGADGIPGPEIHMTQESHAMVEAEADVDEHLRVEEDVAEGTAAAQAHRPEAPPVPPRSDAQHKGVLSGSVQRKGRRG